MTRRNTFEHDNHLSSEGRSYSVCTARHYPHADLTRISLTRDTVLQDFNLPIYTTCASTSETRTRPGLTSATALVSRRNTRALDTACPGAASMVLEARTTLQDTILDVLLVNSSPMCWFHRMVIQATAAILRASWAVVMQDTRLDMVATLLTIAWPCRVKPLW